MPVTAVLIVISIAITLVAQFGENLEVSTWLTFVDLHWDPANPPPAFPGLRDGQVWRLVTPIFLHFFVMHLLFNLFWMRDLGGAIERRWSGRLLLTLVLVTAVISNLAQYLVNWDLRNGLQFNNAFSGGLSGVVYGLFGYVWIRCLRDPSASIVLTRNTVLLMLGWLVLCMTGLLGHVGNMAHLSGLIVGVVAAFLAPISRPPDPDAEVIRRDG